jgi:hypothetical protein
MALIPMKQTVTIIPAGVEDDWGEVTPGTPYTLKCRIEEGAKMVRSMHNSSAGGIHGVSAQEVVSTARVFLDKFVDVKPSDTIEYTDEAGNTRSYTPLDISRKYGLNGKCLLTVVSV